MILNLSVGCRSLQRPEIDKANQAREEAIIAEVRQFFVEAGGTVDDFPSLFDSSQPREARLAEARGVISLLVSADAPQSLINKMVLYLALMLSEAET